MPPPAEPAPKCNDSENTEQKPDVNPAKEAEEQRPKDGRRGSNRSKSGDAVFVYERGVKGTVKWYNIDRGSAVPRSAC